MGGYRDPMSRDQFPRAHSLALSAFLVLCLVAVVLVVALSVRDL